MEFHYRLPILHPEIKPDPVRIQRIRFSEQEDDLLKNMVEGYGTSDWNVIGQLMAGRTARQCRDRYLHYVCPTLRKGGWNRSEDEALMLLCKLYGAKWSIISRSFPNRSNIELRNRIALLRRVGISDSLYVSCSSEPVSCDELRPEQKREDEDNEKIGANNVQGSMTDRKKESRRPGAYVRVRLSR